MTSNTATGSTLDDLIVEAEVARRYSIDLVEGLTEAQVQWRPDENSSAMAWHLGHQGAVTHYLVRNLTAAEPSLAPDFDAVFDSATEEPARGDLPPLDEIVGYRDGIATSATATLRRIEAGDVGAPEQLSVIAEGLLRAVINHEYQHAKWIGEVRATMTDEPAPQPASNRLVTIEGYWVVGA